MSGNRSDGSINCATSMPQQVVEIYIVDFVTKVNKIIVCIKTILNLEYDLVKIFGSYQNCQISTKKSY